MKPVIKKVWIEALRSGKYAQTTGGLCKSENRKKSFCCLGVLTDLYFKRIKGSGKWVKSKKSSIGMYNDFYRGGQEKGGAVLSDRVKKWSGLKNSNPDIENTNATELNDILKLSFSEIADKIEKYL